MGHTKLHHLDCACEKPKAFAGTNLGPEDARQFR
jgi:hypothetical protein